MPTLNPPYIPVGGGGRTVTIGAVNAPAGYHWVSNNINGAPSGGTATSYPVGSNNSNFSYGVSNNISQTWEKDAGNTGPGALFITIEIGRLITGEDPPQPTVSASASGGLAISWSGDGLVQQFNAVVETVGDGEDGTASVSFAPPAGFKGYMWYTISTDYVSALTVNGNSASNQVWGSRGIKISDVSGLNMGGGSWRGGARYLNYPVTFDYKTSAGEAYSSRPNFVIGEYNNADGVDSLNISLSRKDTFTAIKAARPSFTLSPEVMGLGGYESVYVTAQNPTYAQHGQEYISAQYNSAGQMTRACQSFWPKYSIYLGYDFDLLAGKYVWPPAQVYKLNSTYGGQCATGGNNPYGKDSWWTPAPTAMIKTTAYISVTLEKFPEPMPTVSNVQTSPCIYDNGGTITLTGFNFTGVTTTSIPGLTISVTSDTQAVITVPAQTDIAGQDIYIKTPTGPAGYAIRLSNSSLYCYPPEAVYPPPYVPPTNTTFPVVPTTPVLTTDCRAGWDFGSLDSDIAGPTGPGITTQGGTLFLAPYIHAWELDKVNFTLTFTILDIFNYNSADLNPAIGEMISIVNWDRPQYNNNGSYFVVSKFDRMGRRVLVLGCTNTSTTPTPSGVQTGTCLAPPNTNSNPFEFPLSPILNEIYSFAGRAWFWNSFAWHRYCSPTTPTTPTRVPSTSLTMCVPLTGTLSYSGNTYNLVFEDTLSNGNPGNWVLSYVTNGYHTLDWRNADRMLMVYRNINGTVSWGFSIRGIVSTSIPLIAGEITPNGTNTYTFTTNNVDYTATITWGSAVPTPLTDDAITFGTPTPTTTGFTVQVTSYNGISVYTPSASVGTATINSTGKITVTGVAANTSSTVTVNTTRTGYANGTAQVSATSLPLPPAPTVTSISPSGGSTAGATTVTITGTNLTGATAVTIGGVAATSVTVVNETTITATSPAGTAGATSVLVTTPSGTNAANTLFTYNAPSSTPSAPVITASTSGDGSMMPGTVTFSAPISDGGSYITDYEYNVNGGSWQSTYSSSPGTISVYSMTVGSDNTVLIRAITSNGAGATASVILHPSVPFNLVSNSNSASYSGSGDNSGSQLTGQMYSYGSPETLVFTAGNTGTLNYSMYAYDMMGGSEVSISLKVDTTVIKTATTSMPDTGTTALTAGQTVTVTFVGSSMGYNSFSLWMS
jgi:hypothetical protein